VTDSYTIAFWTFSAIGIVTAIAVILARQPTQTATTVAVTRTQIK